MLTQSLEGLPGQLGCLVLSDDGAVLAVSSTVVPCDPFVNSALFHVSVHR